MNKIIDSHAHLTCDMLVSEYDEIIRRAEEVGVERILCICTSIKEYELAKKMKNDMIDIAFGIFPGDVLNVDTDEYLQVIEEGLKQGDISAVGEIGLDYHYTKETSAIQKEIFKKQIQLANKYKVPFLVHMREATKDCLDIIKEESDTKFLIHCFSGSIESANEIYKMGGMISFSGVLTFKNAKGLLEVAKNAPIDKILIETDSPYLTPVPYRGKRNESAGVKLVYEKLVELRDETPECISENLIKNYNYLIGR